MTPQELRSSIIQQAIQGKLVEQRPEEGTGEELFQQIQAEKQALIKAGRIKKEKHIENFGEIESPFDIPDSWHWCRIEDCGCFISGYTPKPHELDSIGAIPYFKVSDMNTTGNERYLIHTSNYLRSNDVKCFWKDTIVYPKNGGAVFTNKKRILHQDSVVDLNTGGYYPYAPMNVDYVYIYFANIDFRKCYKGTALPTIDMDKMRSKMIPVPPLAEQKRIVAKLEEILPLIDRYEAAWNKLKDFNERFPGDMRKSLIQLAIQGKLVKQCDSDEKIDDVLSSIKHKRTELIKSKKLKEPGKINKRSEIELDIPDTWRFVCLNELICKRTDNRGKTPPHSPIKTEQHYIDLLEINAIIPGASVNHDNVEKYLDEATYSSLRGFIEEGDILIATVGSVGKFAMMDNSRSAIAQNIIGIKCFEEIEQKYIFYLLQSPYFYASMGNITMEAVQASIKVPDLMNLRVPLPPPAEQKRIVAKLEEILPLCDRLK